VGCVPRETRRVLLARGWMQVRTCACAWAAGCAWCVRAAPQKERKRGVRNGGTKNLSLLFLSLSSHNSFHRRFRPNPHTHPLPYPQHTPLAHTMVRISVLGDALKTLSNAEKRGKRQVLLRPSSKVVIKFLQVMQKKVRENGWGWMG